MAGVGSHPIAPLGAVEAPTLSAEGLDMAPYDAQTAAQSLLQACSCSACRQPLRDPITLPCGHSSCLQCIRVLIARQNEDAPAVASSSRRPPRYPLAATTIPCPQPGCPRGAIGKGLGSWKGHNAHFGSGDGDQQDAQGATTAEADEEASSAASALDGFVAPLNHSLTVVPSQTSTGFATHYGISKFDVQGKAMNSETSLLRTDVTLTKLIEVLSRYAGPSERKESPVSSVARRAASGRQSVNSLRARRRGHRHHARAAAREQFAPTDDSRTEIHPRFLGILGASEEGMDQFTVGGVSAIQGSDTEDSEGYEDVSDYTQRDYTPAGDDEEDDIGGAYARGPIMRMSASEAELAQGDALAGKTVMTVSPGSDAEDDVLYDNGCGNDSGPSSPVTLTHQKAIAASVDPSTRLASLQTELMDVLECQLCYMLLNAPLTTPCGHTYCRRCFARSLDHSSSCPLCRAEMPPFAFFQEHPCNASVMSVLQGPSSFVAAQDGGLAVKSEPSTEGQQTWALKAMYDERQAAIEEEERASLLSTPLFVCTLGFPCMPTILHVFEPRYRLMIRRCLESGHPRFGMVMHSSDVNSPVPGMSQYGTMLEIKTVQMLPDGRSMIETVGTSRFRVLEKGSLDGYTVGRIEPVEDVAPELEAELELASIGLLGRWEDDDGALLESSATRPRPLLTAQEARAAHTFFQAALGLDALAAQQGVPNTSLTISPALLRSSASEHVQACLGFIDTLRSGSAPWLMTRLNDTYGPMPPASDVAAFGYWMALVMPIDEQEKAKLLPIRSARLRLLVVVHWIEQLRQTWWFNHGCSVQ